MILNMQNWDKAKQNPSNNNLKKHNNHPNFNDFRRLWHKKKNPRQPFKIAGSFRKLFGGA
jgi:hypothetical protein